MSDMCIPKAGLPPTSVVGHQHQMICREYTGGGIVGTVREHLQRLVLAVELVRQGGHEIIEVGEIIDHPTLQMHDCKLRVHSRGVRNDLQAGAELCWIEGGRIN